MRAIANALMRSKLLSAITLVGMIFPFFAYEWPKALLIAACVWLVALAFRLTPNHIEVIVQAERDATRAKVDETVATMNREER